jgi:hypothetical protein
MRHEFHPEALAEYEEATRYYAERDPRVAEQCWSGAASRETSGVRGSSPSRSAA